MKFILAPEIIKLYKNSPNIDSLHLSQNSLNHKDAALLTLALDESKDNFKSKIKILDLSKNNLGKEGAKVFAPILPKNSTL